MGHHLQTLAELTARAARVHDDAQRMIAGNRAAMQKSRQMLERCRRRIDADPLPLEASGPARRTTR
jgi:hypothetical protein